MDDIDSLFFYLKKNNTIGFDSNSARIAMELSDQWEFADKHIRESGIKYKIYPSCDFRFSQMFYDNEHIYGSQNISYNENFTKDQIINLPPINNLISEGLSDQDYTKQSYLFNMGVIFRKPINRYFQLNIDFIANIGIERYSSEMSSGDDIITFTSPKNYNIYPTGNINFNSLIGFYLNTRTAISFSSSASYLRNWDYLKYKYDGDNKIDTDDSFDMRNLNFDMKLNLEYYISPRLSFNVSCGLNYYDYYSQKNLYFDRYFDYYNIKIKEFNYTIDAGIHYDIF